LAGKELYIHTYRERERKRERKRERAIKMGREERGDKNMH